MTIDEIMKNVVTSSTYKKEIGLSFQLGFPRLEMHNNELFVTFYPHIERYQCGNICYYSPQYELKLVYPFRHIVLFKNYTILSPKSVSSCEEKCFKDKAICVPMEILSANQKTVHKLYSLANELLCCREKKSINLSQLVDHYIDYYKFTIESLGLQDIYGGAYVTNRNL